MVKFSQMWFSHCPYYRFDKYKKLRASHEKSRGHCSKTLKDPRNFKNYVRVTPDDNILGDISERE